MPFSKRSAATLIPLILSIWTTAAAKTSEETIATIRGEFAKAGGLEIQLERRSTPYGTEWGPVEDIYRSVKRYPPDLIQAAYDSAIKEGSMEERIGALTVYQRAVYMKDRQANPDYEPLLLRLLSRGRLWVEAYSGTVVVTPHHDLSVARGALRHHGGSRSGPSHEDRVSMLLSAARLCHISRSTSNAISRGPRVEKVLADFEHWFAENKDRISFTKDGEFRLSGSKTKVKQLELTEADRKRIRQDPGCVLRLMDGAFGGNDGLAAVGEPHSRCGAALFGTEGSAAIGGALAESPTGEGLSAGAQATLSSLAGAYRRGGCLDSRGQLRGGA